MTNFKHLQGMKNCPTNNKLKYTTWLNNMKRFDTTKIVPPICYYGSVCIAKAEG